LPEDANLGDYLFAQGLISDEDLCCAISLFSGLPIGRFPAGGVKRGVSRTLPAHLAQRFSLIPVDMQAGHLIVAGSQAPAPGTLEAIKSFTLLAVDFQLITQQNYSELRDHFFDF
jgi:hypothetical protein